MGAALLIGRPEASEAETTLASRKVLYFRVSTIAATCHMKPIFYRFLVFGREKSNGALTRSQHTVPPFADPSLYSTSSQYAPRIKSARDFLAKDFKAALDKKDWAAVAAAYEIQKQAPDSSLRNNPQRFINKFEK